MTDSSDHAEVPHIPELATDYEILRELGRGRRSVVYLAREQELGRLVSIKLLQDRYAADQAAAASLVGEARILGGLQHPHILTLYGTRRLHDGLVALVREYVPGRDLRSELREDGPLGLARAHQVLAELAAAIAYLHHRRLLHRNLRPEHVLLEAETSHVRLSGFSSPPAFGGPAGASFAREALDAAAYMAPEQLAGGPEDARTDIYALGVLGYELLTAQTPWPDASLFTIVERRLQEASPSPAALRPEVPTSMRRAIESALHSDPAERWGTAEAFRAALGDAPAEAASPSDSTTVAAAVPAAAHPDVFPMMPGPHEGLTAAAGRLPAHRLHRKGRRRLAGAAWVLLLLAAAVVVWRVATDLAVSGNDATGDDLWSGTAGVSPVAGPPEADLAATSPGEPAVAYVLSGDAQEGAVGDTLRQWLALRVEDAAGRPVQGVPVRFAVTQGVGDVTPETGATDQYGVAGARLVPRTTGAHVVEAVVAELEGRPAVFRATASPRTDSAAALPSTEAAAAPRLERVRAGVSAGGMHSCALDADGSAACWGGNDNGQLGDGSAERRGSPVRVVAPEPLAALYAGVAHSCGLGVSGSVFCWGANGAGQLGDGSRSARTRPVRVATDVRLVTLGAGSAHSCGLDGSGRPYCWGQNTYGQLGDGSRTGRPLPVPAGGGRAFRSLAVGWDHTCALTADGAAYCWGRNHAGQLGDGSTTHRAEPTAVAGGQRFTAIAAGSGHTCAIASDGAAWCWGQNANGQLGTGDRQAATTPARVTGDERFRALAVGGVHTCGLTPAGLARCWGRNTYGQLGDGTVQDRSSPVPVQGALRFTALHASGAHTCGTAADGSGYCWGYNLEGQLGDGTRSNQRRPVAVIGERQ